MNTMLDKPRRIQNKTQGGAFHLLGTWPDIRALHEEKSTVEYMTTLEEAYEDVVVLLGFSIYFDKD